MAHAAKVPAPNNANLREYDRQNSVVFLKTSEAFGGLSNMAPGFPLNVNGASIRTSEALYQACRFPHRPELQRKIIEQASPMTAKMVGKPFRSDSRPDWDRVRTKIMRWCLRVKLAQNYERFSLLLLSTNERPIVEQSSKDDFWGARPDSASPRLVGHNVLGRLLMELRQILRDGAEDLRLVAPLDLPDFSLFGRPIAAIEGSRALAPGRGESVREPADDARPTPKITMPAPQARKKLIEVSMPLEAINTASAREKSIRHGHPSTLHLWWARRPLAACRAVIFGQLVDDPSAWPDRFPTKADLDAERERLHQVIREMVEWPDSNPAAQAKWERALDAARWEIARSAAWGRGEEPPAWTDRAGVLAYLAERAPPVYDPFCGGGSIPLEAQRLGLRAYGSDLNPVPVLISKALVEIPPKFAGMSPVHPDSGPKALLGRSWRGAEGLAEDVRYYGRWMREQAQVRIGHFYPDATLPDGREATVIAWLWARTVRSPDPAAKGAMVPLASSFVLSSKAGREAIVRVVRDPTAQDGWRFSVQDGGIGQDELDASKLGTKSVKAGSFVCALTGAPIERDYIQRAGKADQLGVRLMAVVAEGDRGRAYLTPSLLHERAAQSAAETEAPGDARSTFLSGPTPTRAMITGGVCSAYGLRTWGHLFTDRQLVGLIGFSDLVGEARDNALADAEAAFSARGLPPDQSSLAEGGRGPRAYADAVATYLGFAVDRLADRCSAICTWDSGAVGKSTTGAPGRSASIRNTFARQAIPMTWDFAEANALSETAANFLDGIEWVLKPIERLHPEAPGQIFQINASANSYPVRPIVISTDPPYYDNIGYADLSDYFYVWLRRSLGAVWPDLFRRIQTPKDEELVATPYRAPDRAEMVRRTGREDDPILADWDRLSPKDRAERDFMFGMGRALTAMRKASVSDAPLAIYYAFKQSEKSADGVSSAGWASFLQAMINAGLMLDGTWPMRTELSNRMIGNDANALASSVVLICRPRPEDARTIAYRDFLAELRREMPSALEALRTARIHPVDIPQAALGPGMAVFSKYAAVRQPDDTIMSVSRAIALINQVREEIAHTDSGDLDPETRFALVWFESYGWGEKDTGQAILLGQSYDLTDRELRESGVLVTERGQARLRRRAEMPEDWRPSTDHTLTAWELAQALNRALNDGGGVGASGVLLGEARDLGTSAHWLARRLFELAENQRMTEEARGWGRLSEAWSAIEAAADAAAAPAPAAAQPSLI